MSQGREIWHSGGRIEVLPGKPYCNSGPHPPVDHADEIELMEVDMAEKKSDKQAVAEEHAIVSGFQEGKAYPKEPRTPDDFAELLDNPELPAENQAAPSPEKLNPHLFGPQGRL